MPGPRKRRAGYRNKFRRAKGQREDRSAQTSSLMYLSLASRHDEAETAFLEASDRPGGRCLTVKDWELKPDLGASQIGGTYARVIDTCNKLGIELGPGSHMNAPYTPVIGDQMVPADTWADSPLNRAYLPI